MFMPLNLRSVFNSLLGNAFSFPAIREPTSDVVDHVVNQYPERGRNGEGWYRGGKLHRDDYGPAAIERDAATGIRTLEGWFKDDKLDRADGPAWIERDPVTGAVTLAEWWKDGKQFEPSAEVHAAWLENSARLVAPPVSTTIKPASRPDLRPS